MAGSQALWLLGECAMSVEQALSYFESALHAVESDRERECDETDYHAAMVYVGYGILRLPEAEEPKDWFWLVKEDYYQLVSALVMWGKIDHNHFVKYLKRMVNRVKHDDPDGPSIAFKRRKTQWEKMRDGELILPEDL